jgi:hypothetical protein
MKFLLLKELNKKNQRGCPHGPYHHPERKPSNARKFTRKEMVGQSAKGV